MTTIRGEFLAIGERRRELFTHHGNISGTRPDVRLVLGSQLEPSGSVIRTVGVPVVLLWVRVLRRA